jgi:hypothetical protein
MIISHIAIINTRKKKLFRKYARTSVRSGIGKGKNMLVEYDIVRYVKTSSGKI